MIIYLVDTYMTIGEMFSRIFYWVFSKDHIMRSTKSL